MNVILFDSRTNLCKSIIKTCTPDSLVIEENLFSVEIDDDSLQNHLNIKGLMYFKNGEVFSTVAPSRFHNFDVSTCSWIEDTALKNNVLQDEIRDLRLYKLKELDVFVQNPLRYNELTDDQKSELAQYRRDLLDVPQQTGFPLDVVFPTKPSTIQ